MKNILLLSVLALIFMTGCSQKTSAPISSAKGIHFQYDSYDKIMEMAKNQNKPVFIDFVTVWCAPCKWLEKDVFELKQVGEYFNENFISLKIDAEKGEGPDIADMFEVYGYPTLVYLDSNGNVIQKHTGMTSMSHVMSMARETVDANNNLSGTY
ncbi:MAG: thioredoxin family protein [Bacteroidota bacterium]